MLGMRRLELPYDSLNSLTVDLDSGLSFDFVLKSMLQVWHLDHEFQSSISETVITALASRIAFISVD